MNRPDEIAALADRLTAHVGTLANTSMTISLAEWDTVSGDMLDAANALRLAATSPGDAVLVTDEMVKAALISLHKNPVSWEHPNTVRAALEAALRLSATSPGDAVREALKAGKIMLLCEECSDNYPEGCGHFSPDTLRVAPNGKWLCDSCYDEARETDDAPWWQDLPRLPFALATAEKAGTDDSALRKAWEDAGGAFYGPNRNGVMREATLLPFLRSLSATPTPPSAGECKHEFCMFPIGPDGKRLTNMYSVSYGAAGMFCRYCFQQQPIQSAAHGGGTKSDGGVEGHAHEPQHGSAFEGSACGRPDKAEAGIKPGPSDPAQEPEAVALKPCAFCGGADLGVHQMPGQEMFWVSCHCCGLEAPSETGVTREQAVTYWNTRPVSLDLEAVKRAIYKNVGSCADANFIDRRYLTGVDKATDAILALIEGRT